MDISATAAWPALQALLGHERVLDSETAQSRYQASTEGWPRRLAGALRPASSEQVPALMRILAEHRLPVYPVSTGRNWGYGSAQPVLDDCVLLDLGDMRRIRHFDAERGVVTLEPGVTQADLRDYLDEHRLPFMVPVTGAGPGCSLLGNALERGYGITPHSDHFAALTSLEAVLADGSVYRPALAAWGGEDVDRGFKWGLGPYVDGLFTQGGFGVVIAVSLALAPQPAHMEAVIFSFPREADLEQAVGLVHEMFRRFRGVLGGVNLLNRRRVLSMLEPYPREQLAEAQVIPEALLETIAKRHQVQPWTGVTALYGEPGVVAAARRALRRMLKPHTVRLMFLSPGRAATLSRLARFIPGPLGAQLQAQLKTFKATTDIMQGRPGEVALPLAYWRSGRPPERDLHPARDRCGLLWFPPLLPLKAADVRRFVDLVHQIMPAHGMEPLVTITCFSELGADSTIPILYDPADAEQRARAHACYEALFQACRRLGYLPYRLNVEHQRALAEDGEIWGVVGKLKAALDPDNLIAPGRYAPRRLPGRSA
ncbi:MAG: FAD-binding oxidoreductase [Gammaproteobacteria bacterium]|nr:FAD-binding oxidoreductase [Gammaproteobacteria bacterium]